MTPVDYLFRLDADSQIGTGHLMRCLAIADALRAQGELCAFACRPLPATLQHKLHTYPLLELDDDTAFWTALTEFTPRWLIVDHYGLDAEFEAQARRFGCKILVLDDLADRRHDADLLLDQGPLRRADDYRALTNADCQLLLGADYALLRPEFVARRKTATTPFHRGFISFGGADPAHACLRTLQALTVTPWWSRCAWTLLAGAANPDWPALQQWLAEHPARVTLLRHSDEVSRLLAEHDFAIGAAGGMMWERCCIGLPTLSIPIVANQQFNDAVIAHFHLCERMTLGELDEPAQLNAALSRLQARAEEYRQRGQALVDGQGLTRLTALLRKQA